MEVIQNGNGPVSITTDTQEGLHKGYDRFQSLLSQLEIHGAGVSTEDVNQKFLRSLPSAWSQVSLITRTKPGVDISSFDDLYNNLRVFENDVKGSTASSSNTLNDRVTSCSNECKESYAKLKKLYDAQREQLSDASIEIKAYTQGLKKVEAQLVAHQQGQLWQAVPTNVAMKVNTVKPIVNRVRPATVFYKTHSPFSRPFNNTTTLRTNFTKQKVNTAEVNAVSAVGGKRETAVKPSAGLSTQNFTKQRIKLQHFNLFSVSQICDKKNKVLFTDSECLVLSLEFKLPDANQVIEQYTARSGMDSKMAKTCYHSHFSTAIPYGGLSFTDLTNTDQDDLEIPALEEIYDNPTDGIFTNSSYNDEGAVADFTNLEPVVNASPIPTSRINSIHPSTQILRDSQSAVQTRSKVTKSSGAHAFKISEALADESWVDAMQEELLQFKIQKVWILVDLPYGKKAIGTKWVYRNKKDERGVMVRNKARLVAQGHRQEAGIDYDEDFASVARIEAIRIFLAFTSYMGFIVYQMDVKSGFLYGKINEEVYVSQPPGFIDPKYPQKVYKVVKALYGLHQDPRACDVDVHLYRSMIGSLMYLTASRPDIMFAVCACSRVSSFDMEAYSNSDYAGANLDRKSTTGGCQFLGRRLIPWQYKKQKIVATSTTEAEYVAVGKFCGFKIFC
ncbi:putative ribonuclease H-like domain-containing protein [Tanacetum coccineum]